MATAKRKPRTTSRPRKRATAKKSGGSSVASILALGAIVAVGAVSLWAATQHKSPQTAISSLFNGGTTSRHNAPPPRSATTPEKKVPAAQPAGNARSNEKPTIRATTTAPVPRPELGLTPAKTATAQPPQPTARPQNAANATPTSKPNQMVAAITPPRAASQNLPPRGVNRPDSIPLMLYAKQKLTIRKTAWDKAPSMGEVEKGRELRSYGQTGKWHRVVVPATDMIGWVHQDMLVIVKNNGSKSVQASAPLTTGSVKTDISAKPRPVTAKTPSANKSTGNHPVPRRGVGEK